MTPAVPSTLNSRIVASNIVRMLINHMVCLLGHRNLNIHRKIIEHSNHVYHISVPVLHLSSPIDTLSTESTIVSFSKLSQKSQQTKNVVKHPPDQTSVTSDKPKPIQVIHANILDSTLQDNSYASKTLARLQKLSSKNFILAAILNKPM